MTQVELVYWWQQHFTKRKIVAATISLPVKVAQTLTSGWGWGCRCEANTNVPGAPRILDPPLVSLIYQEMRWHLPLKNSRFVLPSVLGGELVSQFQAFFFLHCVQILKEDKFHFFAIKKTVWSTKLRRCAVQCAVYYCVAVLRTHRCLDTTDQSLQT